LDINIHNDSHSTTVELKGEIDMHNSPDLRKSLLKLVKKDIRLVLVNLARIDRIDTSGLATLVDFALRLKENDSVIAVYGLDESAADSVTREQVESVLNMADTREGALDKVKNKSEENGFSDE